MLRTLCAAYQWATVTVLTVQPLWARQGSVQTDRVLGSYYLSQVCQPMEAGVLLPRRVSHSLLSCTMSKSLSGWTLLSHFDSVTNECQPGETLFIVPEICKKLMNSITNDAVQWWKSKLCNVRLGDTCLYCWDCRILPFSGRVYVQKLSQPGCCIQNASNVGQLFSPGDDTGAVSVILHLDIAKHDKACKHGRRHRSNFFFLYLTSICAIATDCEPCRCVAMLGLLG